jgi:uncharacterized protein
MPALLDNIDSIEQPGSRVKIRLRVGPFVQTWAPKHAACEPGRMFRDVMVAGPFRRWEHTHLFIPDGQNKSWLEDRVEYEFPLGWFGKLVGRAYTKRRLSRMFAWRHRVTADAVAQEAPNKPRSASN